MTAQFRLSGTAIPADARHMLEEIAEHFAKHASVARNGETVHLEHEIGAADIRIAGETLAIELASNSEDELTMIRTVLAEHLFHFAGEKKFQLTWSEKPKPALPGNMRLATVAGARNVTPHMRRVTFACPNVHDFQQGGLHVRLLLPQNGEAPVWPTVGDDGRIQWPDEKNTAVRIYTIRNVDPERGEVDIDFVLHEGETMPGATFGATAAAGDLIGIMGPGGGWMPEATDLILAGDETALPAMLRIAEAAPAGTKVRFFGEVDSASEEQPIASAADIQTVWLHRNGAAAGTMGSLQRLIRSLAPQCAAPTFIWVGCEKAEAVAIREYLKDELQYDRQCMRVGSYWEK